MIFIFPLLLIHSSVNFYYTAKWLSHTYVYSFSHITLHHVPSQVTRYSTFCYAAGSHCLYNLFFLIHIRVHCVLYGSKGLEKIYTVMFHHLPCKKKCIQHGIKCTLTFTLPPVCHTEWFCFPKKFIVLHLCNSAPSSYPWWPLIYCLSQ